MKKVIVSILTLCMCLSLCCPAFASSPAKSPMWVNILSMSSQIVFDGTDGEAFASVKGKSGTTAISGTLTVYRQSGSNWVYVDSVSGTSSTLKLDIHLDFTGISGAYYKAVFEVVVTRNGIDEPETKTSYETCP